jgi:hypothetical protein
VSTPRWLQCGVRGGGPILAAAKQPAAFECTERQEAEDLASIAAKEYRYHQAMVSFFTDNTHRNVRRSNFSEVRVAI